MRTYFRLGTTQNVSHTHTDRSNFNYTTGLENIMDKSIGRILVKLNRFFHISPFESIQIPLMPAFKKKKNYNNFEKIIHKGNYSFI